MMTYELDEVEKRVLLSEVIDRARADLNEGRPLTEMGQSERPRYGDIGPPPEDLEMFSGPPRPKLSEEQAELRDDAQTLCYTAIRFSGLHHELSNEQWDGLAERLAGRVLGLIESEINARFTALEAAKQEHQQNPPIY